MPGKKSKFAGPRHVRLYFFLLNCPAWHALDSNSRALYIEIAKRYMGTNNGRIPYSVREGAAELGISPATVSRCLAALAAHGFIVPTKKGAFHYKVRHATEWRLTEHDCNGQPATKDFMRWSPPVEATEPRESLQMFGFVDERSSW